MKLTFRHDSQTIRSTPAETMATVLECAQFVRLGMALVPKTVMMPPEAVFEGALRGSPMSVDLSMSRSTQDYPPMPGIPGDPAVF